jgi:double-stranded uracil-DNA glycosylase
MPGPTRAELEAAAGGSVPDVVRRGLDVLFCGVNPGLTSAALGHHFARPGNRFWRALHLGGFTGRVWDAAEDRDLPSIGLGITNLVDRATARASELSDAELRQGSTVLGAKVAWIDPRAVAVLGIGAYRTAFARARAALGPQPERLGGASVWVLPNPSGLNAHHQLPELAEAFAALRAAVGMR